MAKKQVKQKRKGVGTPGKTRGGPGAPAPAPARKPKAARNVTPEGRAAISKAQLARWARYRREKRAAERAAERAA